MHTPRRHLPPRSARAKELNELAAVRTSRWLGNVLAWTGGSLGAFAVYVLVIGYRHSRALPNVPRPTIGPSFSEATTSALGAVLVGLCFSFFALVLVGLALVHSNRRLHTLAFASPVLVFAVLLFAPQLLRY